MEFQKHVNENYKLLRNFKYLKGKKRGNYLEYQN